MKACSKERWFIWLIALSWVFCCYNCHSSQVDVLSYESILFDRLSICKTVSDQAFSRTVYWDQDNQQFIKLWHPNYPLSDCFLRALNCGYYEEIAIIKAVIFDQTGQCRGYTMQRCQEAVNPHLELGLKLEKNKYSYQKLKDICFQNEVFQLFYEKLLENTHKTGLIYLDLVPSNLAIWQGQYVLLDLEGVYLKDELIQFSLKRPHYFLFVLESLPTAYATLIQHILGIQDH